MQAPQPLQRSASTISGRAGPPSRALKRIAPSGQASPQLWQTTPRLAKQSALTAATWSKAGMARSKTGSGQASAQALQKLHSPALKSRAARPISSRTTMCCGQAGTQAPQPVQAAAIDAARDHGGRTLSGHGGRTLSGNETRRPIRKLRRPRSMLERSMAAASMRRAGRTGDQLEHPNQETVSSDNAHCGDRPDQYGQRQESQEFGSSCRSFRSGFRSAHPCGLDRHLSSFRVRAFTNRAVARLEIEEREADLAKLVHSNANSSQLQTAVIDPAQTCAGAGCRSGAPSSARRVAN